MKYILGISSLNRDATASLLTTTGEVVGAVAEERFTRVKQQGGFPRNAVQHLLNHWNVAPSDIESVGYSFLSWRDEETRIWDSYNQQTSIGDFFSPSALLHRYWYRKWCSRAIQGQRRYNQALVEGLDQFGLSDRLRFYHHHYCHALSAYVHSGFNDCLTVTIDWYGSGLSAQIYSCKDGKLSLLAEVPMPHSLGMFYAQVTRALGFRTSRHEGKIVGLAAYGADSPLLQSLRKILYVDGDAILYRRGFANFLWSRLQARQYTREDMAYAYQRLLEEVSTTWIEYFVRATGHTKIALAGGVAANVKNNQRIYEIDGVDQVFVQPAMGDDGAGLGAALARVEELGNLKVIRLPSVYLGPEFDEDEVGEALQRAGIPFERSECIEQDIAMRLANGKVVARFQGRMEYGPRALGNRSILCQATDPAINQELNDRLGRTEFMPFAPVTLVEDGERCYQRVGGVEHACRFMTITLDCTAEMKRMSPAAVHIDGTARPQLVDSTSNPSLADTLRRYREATGIPSIINTSFNMHEEPIVCTPTDAIRAFLEGNLDYLALESFLVPHPSINRKGEDVLYGNG